MKSVFRMARASVMIMTALVCLSHVSMAQNNASVDPCSLLSKAEIQTALKQTVSDGKLSGSASSAAGAPCQYSVGAGGFFSIFAKTAAQGETATNVKNEFIKKKIAVTDAPGIGDHSFYSSPGYGMVQLNTFKGANYLIITMLLPGVNETDQKKAASTLMITALKKM